MCGRYGLEAWPSGLIRRLGGDPRPRAGFRPCYNIAPTDSVLTVINDESRSVAELRWGLVPPFVANADGARLSTFNARIETIATAPTYRDALRTSRCAVLASGYFEWRKNPDGSKTPMWVHRRDDEPVAFAGLWATWRRRTSELHDRDASAELVHEQHPFADARRAGRWCGRGLAFFRAGRRCGCDRIAGAAGVRRSGRRMRSRPASETCGTTTRPSLMQSTGFLSLSSCRCR